MSPDTEAKVRAALAAQAHSITPATLRHPDLPRPRRRLLTPPVASAMVVAAILAGAGLGIGLARVPSAGRDAASRVPTVTVGTTLPVTQGHATVDGITIPVPAGWTLTELAPQPDARRLCLAGPRGPDPACAAGMVFTIAATTTGGGAAIITTHVPDVCPGTKQIMIYQPTAVIDERPAVQYQSRCDGTGPVAEYWQLADSSMTISTPLSDKPSEYENIINSLDLSDWTHKR